MNPQNWQFDPGTERGKARMTMYTVDGQPYLIGFDKNGRPIYHREFGLHFFTRRMKHAKQQARTDVRRMAAHA